MRDPGGLVWGHPRGADPTLMLEPGLEDRELEAGAHVMFDCHGTLDLYCWDGGKTWVVDGEPEGNGRETFRKAGVPDPGAGLVFFHGLGLSHYDIELSKADGSDNVDWLLEEGMVVPLHLLYPGGERERWWLEEVVLVTKDGGEPLFSWGFDPL